MKSVLNIVKPGVVLLIMTVAVALILSCVSLATDAPIAANLEATMNAAMQSVLPAESYTDLAVADEGEVDAVYQAGAAGWIVQVTETGSQGTVTMMVGVSTDYVCTGISITDSSETAGLGAIASQASEKGDAFRAQFVGQSGDVAVSKDGGSIDALSGATITSKAVCKGVTAALAYCANLG